jgi:hypothetical protein
MRSSFNAAAAAPHTETAGNEEKLQEVGDLQAFISGNS